MTEFRKGDKVSIEGTIISEIGDGTSIAGRVRIQIPGDSPISFWVNDANLTLVKRGPEPTIPVELTAQEIQYLSVVTVGKSDIYDKLVDAYKNIES